MGVRIARLFVYPVKSAAGIETRTWELDAFGLRYDRRWMVAGADGRFLSQREHPRLALVRTLLGGKTLRLDAPGMPTIRVLKDPPPLPTEVFGIWRDEVDGSSQGPEVESWLTRFLGMPARLVHMPSSTRRPVDPAYAPAGALVSLADAFPLLLVAQESLDDLNGRLPAPLGVDRFRPNVVITGAAPFAEDGWQALRIGDMRFEVAKPCTRCATTTVDQATGEARGPEPLRTLAAYHAVGQKAAFGQNLVHSGPGRLSAGDPVEVVEG